MQGCTSCLRRQRERRDPRGRKGELCDESNHGARFLQLSQNQEGRERPGREGGRVIKEGKSHFDMCHFRQFFSKNCCQLSQHTGGEEGEGEEYKKPSSCSTDRRAVSDPGGRKRPRRRGSLRCEARHTCPRGGPQVRGVVLR
jgi:hypothetical protein